MKTRLWALPAFAVVVALLVAAPRANAQDSEVGAYGFTSLQYDPQSGQLLGYSETDLYGIPEPYYLVNDYVGLDDPNGKQQYSNTVTGGPGMVEIDQSFAYTPSTQGQWALNGFHYLTIDQAESSCIDGLEICYPDYEDFEYWSGFGIDATWGFPFAPGPEPNQESPSSFVELGSTYDVAATTVPAKCGDVRDQIIQEYVTNIVPWTPQCSNFTQTSPDPNFSFASLNSGDFTWAVIRPALTVGLDNVLADYGSFHINSGYRDPFKEEAVDKYYGYTYYSDSRHQMGDAVDVASNSGTWQTLHNDAIAAHACVEPLANQKYSYAHVHMDWRVQDGYLTQAGQAECPGKWGQ